MIFLNLRILRVSAILKSLPFFQPKIAKRENKGAKYTYMHRNTDPRVRGPRENWSSANVIKHLCLWVCMCEVGEGGYKAGGGPNNNINITLAGVAQWIECRPANGKVASSIPSQGTCLGFRQGPQLRACERQPIDSSLSHLRFSPSLSLSLKTNEQNLLKN